ncbi:hypothetical protein NY2A_b706L [Paramecium bursaria Chlorella virus NY2A]|uniref:Uncharacterized protein b706L n=1 Tax=Paramecium bursaria Chlorella virus NY2A TaxID=46021 RepID=A7IXN1_PBCVN|nr:hypothetical protein NY2A_b706L [Paramecium bursaria Chlorella virus NY2A]ABT15105.1 hypothetical protein NY2A_b706L [Paramecium bursaria Chlorella virus NY2A]
MVLSTPFVSYKVPLGRSSRNVSFCSLPIGWNAFTGILEKSYLERSNPYPMRFTIPTPAVVGSPIRSL